MHPAPQWSVESTTDCHRLRGGIAIPLMSIPPDFIPSVFIPGISIPLISISPDFIPSMPPVCSCFSSSVQRFIRPKA